jgi:hypothetical protein
MCSVFVGGILKERDHLGGAGHRWKDSIKTSLRDMCWDGVGWICLAQDAEKWRARVKAVQYSAGNFLPALVRFLRMLFVALIIFV